MITILRVINPDSPKNLNDMPTCPLGMMSIEDFVTIYDELVCEIFP